MRVLIALLIVVTSLLVVYRVAGPDASPASGEPRLTTPGDSDYYMRDAVIRQMDEQGDLAYRMTIAESLHFPDESARLSDIDVHYLAGSSGYWDITAARGRVPPNARHVYLYNGVKGVHPRPDGQTITIMTDNAWIRPELDRVDTQSHVTAVEPGRRVEAVGMEVDLETDRLQLLNQVRVTYEP